MAGLVLDGSNPDVGVLYDLNGIARSAPSWCDRGMEFIGEYGIVLALVVVLLWCWWTVRRAGTRQESVAGVAGLLWAPLAAGVALLVNMPIRGFVRRPRPFVDHKGLDVLLHGQDTFSFVSDLSTLAMAVAVGVFVVRRGFGFAAIGLAVVEGFSRVYLGVHYPTDVIGGFALGTAVALLLTPVATAALTPLVSVVARSRRLGRLVRSRRADLDGLSAEGDAAPVDTREVGVREGRTDDTNLAA